MYWTIILSGILAFLIWEWLRPNSTKKDKPGKFFYTKKWLFSLILALNSRRKLKTDKKQETLTDRKKRGYGQSITDSVTLEACQPLEENEQLAIDTTYFNGFGEDGTSLALRIARKHNREGELWVMLDIPGVGFFQHPIHPDTGVYNMGANEYRALGCKFQMLEPMRRWKVTYNGLLRQGLCNDLQDKPEQYVNVNLRLKWECYNNPFNFDTDLDKSLLAEAVANEKWTTEFWEKLRGKHQTHYEQCGELSGTIEIEGHPTRQVYLKGFRDHTFGVRDWTMFYRYAIHFIWIPETGMMAMVAVLWMPGYITFLRTGYLTYATGETYPVTAIDLDIQSITKEDNPPDTYSFSFQADDVKYHVEFLTTVTPEVYHYTNRTSRILERLCTYKVNGLSARGLTEYHYRNPEGPPMDCVPSPSVRLLGEAECADDVVDDPGMLCLPLDHPGCGRSHQVGGKGSQLGLLTSIQKQVAAKVPAGFCIKLTAFDLQVKQNIELDESFERIICSIRDNKMADLQTRCSDTVELLASCKICPSLESCIASQLQTTFGESYGDISLAVRSSAAGEDGSEASSAGQMETYLGVRGLEKILEAIRKCWASAYTYLAVEYRRQNGQPIRTPVGVVIQEMVQSDVSGVLFTNDPITGNSNKMVLDASYGLGEVVVSGKTTPDTIVIQRHFDNTLVIKERNIGDKNVRISVAESGGTHEVEMESSSQQCCLSDDQILQLCTTAIKVEDYFGSCRDVEWAVQGDTVYLLQARPITTTEQETDEDFIHEFDSPVETGREYITTCNIGEMMPGCVTPLTNSVFAPSIDWATQSFASDFAGFRTTRSQARKHIFSNSGRLFLNMTFSAAQAVNSLLFQKEGLELNLMGEIMEDHKLDFIRSYGHINKSFLSRLYTTLRFFYVLNKSKKIKLMDTWYERLPTYKIGEHCHTVGDLYTEICQKLSDYHEVWDANLLKSGQSGFWGSVAMGIISDNATVWSVDNISDIALLLAQCQDVFSAEVPTGIQNIARKIVEDGHREYFLNRSDTECAMFLSSETCSEYLKQIYKTFMDRHGHRCVREVVVGKMITRKSHEVFFDPWSACVQRLSIRCLFWKAEFIEKSWRAEPEKLIRVIKAVLKAGAYTAAPSKDIPSIEDALERIKSPVTAVGKFILRKWIIPQARKGVGQREYGKSIAINMGDKVKQAYWRLAHMLVQEGRLPEEQLMFFLTHDEIGQLIATRSARLISRAKKRQKVLPIQKKTEFKKTFQGRPEPIVTDNEDEQRKATFTMNGMPVSRGSIKGVARVVETLEDANTIKKGDILIVPYTDVGWSPYFPLISGLVTEMGGLCSHGAVVAREYGLPCVVNVPGVTKRFKTGDHIHLDGTGGAVHRLEE